MAAYQRCHVKPGMNVGRKEYGFMPEDVDIALLADGGVNGLAVFDLGDFSFGRPSRITAKTYAGRRGVINIDHRRR